MQTDTLSSAAVPALLNPTTAPDAVVAQSKKAICDFCLSKLSEPDLQVNRPISDHHTESDCWIKSVSGSCMICTLLLEHMRTTVHDLEGKKKEQQRVRPGRAEDGKIRSTACEEVLVEWFEKTRSRLEFSYPLYQSHIQDAGGRELWRIRFEPVVERLRCDGLPVTLPLQSFLFYAADYDGDNSPKHDCLADSTGSVETMNQIAAWDGECKKNHNACKMLHRERSTSEWVPTRLIYVGDDKSFPRLVETGGQVSDKFKRYTTLSYAWGYDPGPTNLLTHDNYNQQLSEINQENMPQTFKDAIQTTRRLGINYLWIDALCLLQKDADEWLREAPLMHEVYGNATLSLAAVSSMNNEQGLYRTRSTSGVPPAIVSLTSSGATLDCRVVREDFWHGEILGEPLYQRGWCLQERVLAPRLLHFQRRQVYWQCPSLTASEALPDGLSTVIEDERRDEMKWRQSVHRTDAVKKLDWLEEADMHEFWRLTVASYTKCNLTKSTDKLMAIASIASKMRRDFRIYSYGENPAHKEEAYYVGIWQRGFVQQLAWKVTKWRPAVEPRVYRAPSWTWASVDGVVMPPVRIELEKDYEMEVWPSNGINLQHMMPGVTTGPVHFGSLTVQAALYSLEFQEPPSDEKDWEWVESDGRFHDVFCRLCLDQRLEELTFENKSTDSVSISGNKHTRTLKCLVVMLFYAHDLGTRGSSITFSGSGLAVRRISGGTIDLYSRFGLVEFNCLGEHAWNKLQASMVTKDKMPDEVAPSDNLPTDRFIATIL